MLRKLAAEYMKSAFEINASKIEYLLLPVDVGVQVPELEKQVVKTVSNL